MHRIVQEVLADIGTAAFIAKDPTEGGHRGVQSSAIISTGVHTRTKYEHQARCITAHSAGRAEQVGFNDHLAGGDNVRQGLAHALPAFVRTTTGTINREPFRNRCAIQRFCECMFCCTCESLRCMHGRIEARKLTHQPQIATVSRQERPAR